MKMNDNFDFLADICKYSVKYAVEYALSANNPKCWDVVLSRPDMRDEEAYDLAMHLRNREVLLNLFTIRPSDPRKIVDTTSFLYDDAVAWSSVLNIKTVKKYLEDLCSEELLSSYGCVKSSFFWKSINLIKSPC